MSSRLPIDPPFHVSYLGKEFSFRTQNALQQLSLPLEASSLITKLLSYGLEPEHALALAFNCALLYQTLCGNDALNSPEDALEKFTIKQIASLCRLYQAGPDRLEDFALSGWDELGINEGFKEDSADVQSDCGT